MVIHSSSRWTGCDQQHRCFLLHLNSIRLIILGFVVLVYICIVGTLLLEFGSHY